MMGRAKAAGFHTLILTVDVPVDSRRERQRRANLRIPPKVDAAMVWSMILHPEWTLGTLREGIPSLRFCEDYVDRKSGFSSTAHAGHIIRGQPGWADIDEIRAEWGGPFVVKGVTKVTRTGGGLSRSGVDAIWLSNHTGPAVRRRAPPRSTRWRRCVRRCPDVPLIFDSGVNGRGRHPARHRARGGFRDAGARVPLFGGRAWPSRGRRT
jgi:L-lactate dehydrogenase (cytochrome)